MAKSEQAYGVFSCAPPFGALPSGLIENLVSEEELKQKLAFIKKALWCLRCLLGVHAFQGFCELPDSERKVVSE